VAQISEAEARYMGVAGARSLNFQEVIIFTWRLPRTHYWSAFQIKIQLLGMLMRIDFYWLGKSCILVRK